jgi:hypothetical protein
MWQAGALEIVGTRREMTIVEFFARLLCALRAPDESDVKAMKTWRQTIAATVSAVVLFMAFSFFRDHGWIPHMSAVAMADDFTTFKQSVDSRLTTMQHSVDTKLNSVQQKTDAISLLLIKNGIENAMRDSCTARARQNQAALDMANAKLYGHDGSDGLMDQYRDLTGHSYDQKDCRALLISTSP